MRVYLHCFTCGKDLKDGEIDDETSLLLNGSDYYVQHCELGHDLVLRKHKTPQDIPPLSSANKEKV